MSLFLLYLLTVHVSVHVSGFTVDQKN